MNSLVERLRARRMLATDGLVAGTGRRYGTMMWVTNEPDHDCAAAADEIERLHAEVERLTKKVVGMDVIGLAYAQRDNPSPFGDVDTIGSPAAYLDDFGR